ncbi:MAG: thioredoxin family protein [Bacteroidales bacterium]|nr:thioredoxin family protein [Bacteroidales bacterium]
MKKLIFLLLFIPLLASSQGLSVGDKAVDFTLKNVDGKMVSLNDYNNEEGVILIFSCNHCPYSVAYEDRIIALAEKYNTKAYPVVMINPNDPISYPADSYENMIVRAKEKNFNFPYLFDDGQKIYPQYGATRTPHVYLLHKENGAFYVAYIGAIDNNYKDASLVTEKYVEDAITALKKGEKPAVSLTKTIGCSIKDARTSK